ncbi:hypothetical protein D3C75_1218080 [compost metagenome]
MEREGLARLWVIKTEIHLQRLISCHYHFFRQAQRYILLQLLGLEQDVGFLLWIY